MEEEHFRGDFCLTAELFGRVCPILSDPTLQAVACSGGSPVHVLIQLLVPPEVFDKVAAP